MVVSADPTSLGGPTSRKSFTSAQKLDHLAAYEAALANGQGEAYRRQHRLCSSLIGEWRRFREVGVQAGNQAGQGASPPGVAPDLGDP